MTDETVCTAVPEGYWAKFSEQREWLEELPNGAIVARCVPGAKEELAYQKARLLQALHKVINGKV